MAFSHLISFFRRNKDPSSYTLLSDSGEEYNSRLPSFESEHQSRDSVEKQHVQTSTMRLSTVDPRTISDATIGLSDGLTVPFALTAGLSALGDTRLVIYAGLAELVAGAISMGLGGYLGAVGESQAYQATLNKTRRSITEDSEYTRLLILSTFEGYGFSNDVLNAMVAQLSTSQTKTEDFLMRFHHKLPESTNSGSRAYISAFTIALGYFLGGLTPLAPYFILETNRAAFLWSIVTMVVALFTFGYVKACLVGEGRTLVCLKSGVQMTALGGVAAAAAMGCVRVISP